MKLTLAERAARRARFAAQAAELAEKLNNPARPELAPHSDVRGAMGNPELVKGIGVVTARDARVTSRYALRAGLLTWDAVSIRDAHRPAETLRHVPTVGTASRSMTVAQLRELRPHDATVRVTRDGVTSIVSARDFAPASESRERSRDWDTRSLEQHLSDCERLAETIGYVGDVDG